MGSRTPLRVVLNAADGPSIEGYFDENLVLEEQPVGTTRFDRISLSGGGDVYLTCLNVDMPVNMHMERSTKGGYVGSTTCVTGRFGYRLGSHTGIANPARSICFLIPKEGGYFSLEPGQTIRTVGVTVTEEMMERYLGGDIPEALRRLYVPEQNGDIGLVDYPTSPRMRLIAGMMSESDLTGGLRNLEIEGLAMALLALQANALGGRDRTIRDLGLNPSEKSAIQAARDRLLADLNNPPQLGELASEVGLPVHRLNAGLKEMFGGTAFELARSARLDHAAHLLRESDLSVKRISWLVGYRHVANFSRAFAARFGQSPAVYAQGNPKE